MRLKLLATASVALIGGVAQAAQIPINVTGYNEQFTVSADGASPVTATYDGGTGLGGWTFYQVGQNSSAPLTGLPMGTTFVSASDPTTSYTLAGADRKDAIYANEGGTFTLVTPAAYSTLSILTSTGSGNGTVGFTIHYQNGDSASGNVASPDWFNNSPVAIGAGGRTNSTGSNYDHVSSPGNNPNLYQEDIGALTEPTEPIVSIDFNQSGCCGNSVVWAISGTLTTPEPASLSLFGLGGLSLLGRRRKA